MGTVYMAVTCELRLEAMNRAIQMSILL